LDLSLVQEICNIEVVAGVLGAVWLVFMTPHGMVLFMTGIGASQCSSHEYSVIVNRYQPNWGFFLPNKWSQ
jgi:hypothetical protein